MEMAVIDGIVHFAKWLVKFETESMYCYTVAEKDALLLHLQRRDIKYTIEEVPEPVDTVTKTQGIKYNSRSEALAHIQENKTPDSIILPRVLDRLVAIEEKLTK